MKNTLKEIQDIEVDISEEIENNNDIPIIDGIINCENYVAAKTKILWVLKEANSTKSWKYQDYLSTKTIQRKIGTKEDTLQYEIFRRILYTSYGLINKIEYSCIPLAEEKSVYSIGEEIAFINIKKTGGGNQSDDNEIAKAYAANEKLLLKQIEEYAPNILIFGNTLKYFNLKELGNIGWDLSGDPIILDENTKNTHLYPISKNKLIIHPWHPSYFIVSREVYCSEIINAGLQWRKLFKN